MAGTKGCSDLASFPLVNQLSFHHHHQPSQTSGAPRMEGGMSKGGSGCCDEREGGMRLRWMNNTYLAASHVPALTRGPPAARRLGTGSPVRTARNHADLAVGVELRVVS